MPRDPDVSYGVAVILWRNEREVLIHKRRGAHAAGRWSLPGGWVDRGRTMFEQGALEVKQEFGLILPSPLRLYTVREENFPHFQCASIYLETVYRDAEPVIMEPEKCEAFQWIDIWASASWPDPLFPNLYEVLRSLPDTRSAHTRPEHEGMTRTFPDRTRGDWM